MAVFKCLTHQDIELKITKNQNIAKINSDTNANNYKPKRYVGGQAIQLPSIQNAINEYRSGIPIFSNGSNIDGAIEERHKRLGW